MLVIRTMNDVFRSLTNNIRARCDRLTDFNIGSALRTLSEAIAIQFEEFYYAIQQHTTQAIENSTYEAFGFEREMSAAASGVVTITFRDALTSELLIPAGTVFCTSSYYGYIYYQSKEDYTAEAGSLTADIEVVCTEIGEKGNVPAGAIETIVTSNSNISSVTNSNEFTSGREEETESSRRERFRLYVDSLSRGTEASLVYGALEVDGVEGAYVSSQSGVAYVYAHGANGTLPASLKSAIETNLENYRAAGIQVIVSPVIRRYVSFSVTITIRRGEDASVYRPIFLQLLQNRVNACKVGEGLYQMDLFSTVKSAYPDVVVNMTFNSDSTYSTFSDVAGSNGILIVAEREDTADPISVTCVNAV